MDRLNFNHLFYFYIVAKEGSIKDASERLHVSQPTISDQIKLLEEFLESKLFLRKNRSLELTDKGEQALLYAQKIFDLSKELTSQLRHSINMPKKSLDVGISLFMSNYFLYDTILPLFGNDNIAVNVKENERHLLLADLEEGKLDLIFSDSKDGISSNMGAYRVGINKTFVVAHKKYKKHRKNFPDCLNEIPFFNYTSDSFLKYEIDLFFRKHGLAPKVIGQGDDTELFETVTRSELAFTIVPEVAKKRMCSNKDIIVLGELKELQTSVWGIINKNYKGIGYKLLKEQL